MIVAWVMVRGAKKSKRLRGFMWRLRGEGKTFDLGHKKFT